MGWITINSDFNLAIFIVCLTIIAALGTWITKLIRDKKVLTDIIDSIDVDDVRAKDKIIHYQRIIMEEQAKMIRIANQEYNGQNS